VRFNINNGSSALVTIILMIVVLSISAFGFILLINYWNQHSVNVSNDENLTGITTSGDIYNGTNETLHGLSTIMPNFIWIIIIFFFVVFLTILALALKRN